MTDPLFVRARRAVLPAGEGPASLLVADGVFQRVGRVDDPVPAGAVLVDAGDAVLLPGLVDPHVHCNEPGRTEWEGFETATRAAAAGGVTTIVDMPLNSLPPTTTLLALHAKTEAAARVDLATDVAFWGGAVPGNLGEWQGLADAGVCGWKAFLADSGVPEFPPIADGELEAALREAARLDRPLLVHAEAGECLAPASAESPAGGRSYGTWLGSRPAATEVTAVARIVRALRVLARDGCRPQAHVVHLSAAESVAHLRAARAEGLRLTAETCPHYLTLAAEEVEDGATLFKCAPPIRARANQGPLWQALLEGDLDCIASDHSPSPPEGKALDAGDFMRAWGGVASLGLSLPVVWTAAKERGIPLARLVRWMSAAPAALAGLDGRKGALAEGRDADFVLFDLENEWSVRPEALWTRHRLTPYAGRRLRGRVRATFLRGRPVYEDGAFPGAGRGRVLRRAAALPEEKP